MASTIVVIDCPPTVSDKLYLFSLAGVAVGNASGYSLTQVTGWLHKATVTDAVAQAVRGAVRDSSGNEIAAGYATLADDTGTYQLFAAPAEVALTTESTEMVANAVSTQADIAALIAAWVDGGRLDLIIDAIKAKTDLLGTGSVTISAPVGTDGTIAIIYQGDDYASGRALSFTFNSGSYNVSGATSLFEAKPVQGSSFSAAGTMTDNGDGTATAVVPITSAQSDLLETGPVTWSLLNITSAGLRETVTKGSSPLERRKH